MYEVVIDDPETKEGHTATWGWDGMVSIQIMDLYTMLFTTNRQTKDPRLVLLRVFLISFFPSKIYPAFTPISVPHHLMTGRMIFFTGESSFPFGENSSKIMIFPFG